MADNTGNNNETGSGFKPPMLKNAADFSQWKIRFENFITFNEPELWYSFTEGPHIPECIETHLIPFYSKQPVPLRNRQFNAEDLRLVKLDHKAYASLTLGLPISVLTCVTDFKTAKSLWEQLEIMFGGNLELKQIKKDKLKYQFDTFNHINGETVAQQLQRFVQLVNELKTNEIKYDTYDLNKKLLHTLPESWKQTVSLIKSTMDITAVKIEDMIAKVESMEIDESTRNNSGMKIEPYKFQRTSPGVSALVSDMSSPHFETVSEGGFGLFSAPTNPPSAPLSQSAAQSQTQTQGQQTHSPSSSAPVDPNVKLQVDEQKFFYDAFLASYECFLAGEMTKANLTQQDLEEVDPVDLEAMDLTWQMAMISVRIKKFYRKHGPDALKFDGANTKVGYDLEKVRCYNCNLFGHFSRNCKAPRNPARFSGNSNYNNNRQPQRQGSYSNPSSSNQLTNFSHNNNNRCYNNSNNSNRSPGYSGLRSNSNQVTPNSTQNPSPSQALIISEQDGSFDWSSHAAEFSPANHALVANVEDSEFYDAQEHEHPFYALMAIDLPSEVTEALCTQACIDKVKLYAEHNATLLENREREELKRKEWDRERAVFEGRIRSLMCDIEVLKGEKFALQKQYDANLSLLTKSQAELAASEIRVNNFELSSKTLQELINKQIHGKLKKGLGYHDVSPPFNHNYTVMPPSMTGTSQIPASSSSDSESHDTSSLGSSEVGRAGKSVFTDSSKTEHKSPVSNLKQFTSAGFLEEESGKIYAAAPAASEQSVSTTDAEQQRLQSELECLILKAKISSVSTVQLPTSEESEQVAEVEELKKRRRRRSRKGKTPTTVEDLESTKASSKEAEVVHVAATVAPAPPVGPQGKPPVKQACELCRSTKHATNKCFSFQNLNIFNNSANKAPQVSNLGGYLGNQSTQAHVSGIPPVPRYPPPQGVHQGTQGAHVAGPTFQQRPANWGQKYYRSPQPQFQNTNTFNPSGSYRQTSPGPRNFRNSFQGQFIPRSQAPFIPRAPQVAPAVRVEQAPLRQHHAGTSSSVPPPVHDRATSGTQGTPFSGVAVPKGSFKIMHYIDDNGQPKTMMAWVPQD